ncbi:MAG TPA: ectonucleotide pyrophosphatase/phosphodiesterase [Planctomycetaceae bacterium]|jgi:predicted AlkP superfamily pyrophosphatase or phosphodiesterase|nr:ectonucleotide pyrophosphatase/phosphodiesterase [Planctomycetaceae bacterium]
MMSKLVMMTKLARVVSRVILLATALLFFVPRSNQAAAADQSRAVILISVDGLASFYLDDPRAEMPTIRALAAAGVRAARMKASAPTVTWPNHTTLVTGVTPARHGVVGNDYFDRARRKKVVLISDPEFDKDQIVRVPTIYDVAKASGLATAAIRWPATRNAKALDWTLPDVFSDELLHRFTTPALMAECKQAGIWAESDVIRYGQRELRVVSDDMCTRIFNFILRQHHPNLALLHLTHVDSVEHVKGPRTPEAYAAIKAADEQVRQVWDEVKRDYPGQATLMIVSDHGFSPVERLILPNVPLRDAKLVDVKAGKADGGAVHVVTEGGAALVYVLDSANRDSTINQVERLFAGAEGIDKVVGPEELKLHGLAKPQEDPRSPDLVLFAREGYSFDEAAAGSAATVPRRDLRGMHGHDENLPCMYATFVAWGAGIQPRTTLGEIQNTDVAPTIAHLLGLPLTGADGKALAAALAK